MFYQASSLTTGVLPLLDSNGVAACIASRVGLDWWEAQATDSKERVSAILDIILKFEISIIISNQSVLYCPNLIDTN